MTCILLSWVTERACYWNRISQAWSQDGLIMCVCHRKRLPLMIQVVIPCMPYPDVSLFIHASTKVLPPPGLVSPHVLLYHNSANIADRRPFSAINVSKEFATRDRSK